MMEILTLGQLIEKIEKCGLTNDQSHPKTVDFDFGTAIPTTLDSWRGDYSQLALGYKLTGYDNEEEHLSQTTIKELLTKLKSAIGQEYTGWKGGEYTMHKDTPVWVANAGNVGSTGIVDVIDCDYFVVLATAYCEC